MTTPFDNITVGTPAPAPRIGTLSPYDFAYWASTFVTSGSPTDYIDNGPETNGLSLVLWAASQVGVALPADYGKVLLALSEDTIDIDDALVTRGAILVGLDHLAVCMGLNDVVTIVNGRYFQIKTTSSSTYQTTWQYAARLPGLVYD